MLLISLNGCNTVSEDSTNHTESTSVSENKSEESPQGSPQEITPNPVSDFNYEENQDGTISITGYLGKALEVVIPSTIHGKAVTTIGDGAFMQTAITSITLPDTITKIGQNVFYNCHSLLNITFPKDLIKIGENSFTNCISLKIINIPNNLDLFCLEYPAFYNTPALEKIIFDDGREEIKGYAFFDITSNVEIIIPKSVKKFSADPFFIHGPAKIIFLGNFPEILEKTSFYGEPTIYYDPTTEGWNECEWKDQYPLEPLT